ncbi:MAG TPA: DUF2325 domain-containing protein [Thermodesulfobacteriaceae bacterium]|nr:DUF2325 domain-containing protein [Thermodesulfobacteriaceae bacterium]
MAVKLISKKGFNVQTNRKKIWDIDQGFRCSVVGTCLDGKDVKRLARKLKYQPDPELDPEMQLYQAHVMLVTVAGEQGPQGRVLHKYLDRKYMSCIRRYGAVRDEREITELWKADLKSGKINGSYWAVMTHGSVSQDLAEKFYGVVHMLSHYAVSELGSHIKKIESLDEKIRKLVQKINSERESHEASMSAAEKEISILREQAGRVSALAAENEKLRAVVERLGARRARQDWIREKKALEETLVSEQVVIERLRRRISRVETKNGKKDQIIRELRLKIKEFEGKEGLWVTERMRLQHQLSFMRTGVSEENSETRPECKNCGTSRCPGPDLCGRRLLYVGGHHHLVPHYKALAASCNADLTHHDGGTEASINRLYGVLSRADVVICPVDCISHDACKCVKKVAKRCGKQFFAIRGSGVSALARCLEDIGGKQAEQ